MRIPLLQRLFRRSTPCSHAQFSPSPWAELRVHERIADDVAADPAMCVPRMGLTTAHVTRVIDVGETMADSEWDRTATMETAVITRYL